jgi:putative ABC transport system permease protein
MRKVLGAEKHQVFLQFITESMTLVFISVILAVLLAYLLLPLFNNVSGKSLDTSLFYDPYVIASVVLFGISVSVMAGAYPSLVLSRGKIINILKSGFRFTGSNSLRRTLIVFQFMISAFLIVTTVIILQQLSFIRNKNLGFNRDKVLILPIDKSVATKYDDLKTAFLSDINIQSVGGAYEEPTDIGWGDGLSKGSEFSDQNSISINALPVDEDFIKTVGVSVIAGRNYTKSDVLQFDTSNGGENLHHKYIINESAAKAFGWTPQEAINQVVTKGTSGPVVGVVKDFHFRSFHERIGPMAFFLDKRMVLNMFVKISGNIPQALSHLESSWKQRVKDRPFDYHFLDQDFDALYSTETRSAKVFTSFAAIAITLACLGLFALTAFTMTKRTKEIGIRKVLGAGISDILVLVSKDFIKLVVLAFIIAIPVSWFMIRKWLDDFVYRINISWYVFVLTGLFMLLLAFIAISVQAIKTAMNNPVNNLRTE